MAFRDAPRGWSHVPTPGLRRLVAAAKRHLDSVEKHWAGSPELARKELLELRAELARRDQRA